MAIVTRGRRRYYYQSRWENGQVVTEYVGAGDLADIAAMLERMERDDREQLRREMAEQRAAEERLDRTLDALQAALRALTQEVLLAEGYYLHKGQWRKRRERRTPQL